MRHDKYISERLKKNEDLLTIIEFSIHNIKIQLGQLVVNTNYIIRLIEHYRKLIKEKSPDVLRTLISTLLDHVVVGKEIVDVFIRINVVGLDGGVRRTRTSDLIDVNDAL